MLLGGLGHSGWSSPAAGGGGKGKGFYSLGELQQEEDDKDKGEQERGGTYGVLGEGGEGGRGCRYPQPASSSFARPNLPFLVSILAAAPLLLDMAPFSSCACSAACV